MEVATRRDLAEEISDYWDGRAGSYSNGVVGELEDDRRTMWTAELSRAVEALGGAGRERPLRALDIGCGPGFFSALLTDAGCVVDAVDGSEEMLARACANVMGENPEARVTFHQGDFSDLPFTDGTFDLAVARNVTWLMREPEAIYAEWLRVLRPGGRLLVFDGNWYLYLYDPAIDAQRHADQDNAVLEGWDDDAQATSDEERWCEEIARNLPLSPVVRPEWDLDVLTKLGAASVSADKEAWKRLWTPNEQSYYSSSPMFKVEAIK